MSLFALRTFIATMLLIRFGVILLSFRYSYIWLCWDYHAVDSELYYTQVYILVLSDRKDPYQPASMMECHKDVNCSLGICSVLLERRVRRAVNQQIPWCCASAARARRNIKRQCPGHNWHWLAMLSSNLSFRMWECCIDMWTCHVTCSQVALFGVRLGTWRCYCIYFEWMHCWEQMSSSHFIEVHLVHYSKYDIQR